MYVRRLAVRCHDKTRLVSDGDCVRETRGRASVSRWSRCPTCLCLPDQQNMSPFLVKVPCVAIDGQARSMTPVRLDCSFQVSPVSGGESAAQKLTFNANW
ncbi:hypothetical protein CGRA01v4_03474 [Colletotrichum graminicola]|nr:hypothetical protein CGRA01v4_03474 [Colletotrichum graminicola]